MVFSAVEYVFDRTDSWAFWGSIDNSNVASCMKGAATITTFAVAILASSYLAYTNPSQWWLTISSVGVVSLYTLPKFLRYGNTTMIKVALVVNLTVLSSLLSGGISVESLACIREMLNSFKTYQLESALWSASYSTLLLGYGIPLCQVSLETAYHMLQAAQDVDLHRRFVDLQEYFHQRPEIGLGFLQGNLWQSFILHLTLFFKPIFARFCDVRGIIPPAYVMPMAMVTFKKLDLKQLDNALQGMENRAEEINSSRRSAFSDEEKESCYLRLKLNLVSLDSAQVSSVIPSLLTRGANLIPDILSNTQFLQLFEKDILNATNREIQTFLDLVGSWEKLGEQYGDLNNQVIQLEQEIRNLQGLNPEVFSSYEKLKKEYDGLRAKVEKVHFKKHIWQKFVPLWGQGSDLPFEKREALLKVLHNQNLFTNIEDIYRSLISAGQANNPTLFGRIQYIRNKIAIQDGGKEEEISAYMYLGMNHQFVQKDYEDLQAWLEIDSLSNLEDAMSTIELATKKDLYVQRILSGDDTTSKEDIRGKLKNYINKEDIRKKLEDYIKTQMSSHLVDRVRPQKEIDPMSLVNKMIEKVMRAVYYAIASGLALVPVFIQPYAGGAGFVIGLCFFTLRRFGFPGIEEIVQFSNEVLDNSRLGRVVRVVCNVFLSFFLNYRVFSFDSQRRVAANVFANADFCRRMRMIHAHVAVSLFIIITLGGGFLRGISLANEVVDLVL